MKTKLLTQMVEQFAQAHNGLQPAQIIVAPLALVALGIKRSVAPVWHGIPVKCREISLAECVQTGKGKSLGVFLDDTMQIVSGAIK